MTEVRHIRVLFHTFYYKWAKEYGSLYRGLRYQGFDILGSLSTGPTVVFFQIVRDLTKSNRRRFTMPSIHCYICNCMKDNIPRKSNS